MSLKWPSSVSETGILRKNEPFERKEELLVFGYSCKIFRDNEKALHIDQGKHLIPWMGDETLKIDRYDARGALHELTALEAPPGGHDWHLELTDAEKRVEVLCDEERYRALYCDENEEEMYKEEELKRLHAVGMGRGYKQVGFKYDDDQGDKAAAADENSKKTDEKAEDDEPFVLDNELNVPPGIAVPETKKLNAIIEKTALFISSHGTQMEILLKAKQAGNSQFDFLSLDCPLHAYYRYMVDAIKHHSYVPSLAKTSEQTEVKQEETDNYLHPSLAAPPLQAAPAIPSIHYKPSADCDYTMLITKMRGTESQDDFDDDEKPADVPKGELAPPGTVPLTLPHENSTRSTDPQLYVKTEITKGPVMYLQGEAAGEVKAEEAEAGKEAQATPVGYDSHGSNTNSPNPDMMAKKSLGLNLMHYYNSDSASESDSSDTEASVKSAPHAPSQAAAVPPTELQLIIDKMAAYVARNGDSFESTVRARNDPRFSFLEPNNKFYAYYKKTMVSMCKENTTSTKTEEVKKEKVEEKARSADGEKKGRAIAPVSFSIKKLKEPEPVLPKPALPYESSSEEEDAENADTKGRTPKSQPATNHTAVHPYVPQTLIPPSIIYKIDATNANLNDEVKKKSNEKENLSKSRRSKHKSGKDISHDSSKDNHNRKDSVRNKTVESNELHSNSNKPTDHSVDKAKSKDRREKDVTDSEKNTLKQADVQNSKSKDKKENRQIEVRRSSDEVTKSKIAEIKVKEPDEDVIMDSKEVVDESGKDKEGKEEGEVEDGEIITVDCDTGVESPTEFIDLTGDVSDDKTSGTHKDVSKSKRKQLERKQRAAAFLAAVQRGEGASTPGQPAPTDVTAIIQPNTLASVMVKTLCDIQAKQDAEEEQKERRKHKKRKHHRSKNQSEESSKEETEGTSRKERHKKKRKLKQTDRAPSEQYSHRHREEPEQHEKRKKKKDSKESSRSKKSKHSRSSSKSKKERKRSPSKIAVNNDNDNVKIENIRQAEDNNCSEKKEKKDDKSVRKTSRRREKATYSEGEWEQDSGGESDVKQDSASSAGESAVA